jgi:hypothetical protein
VLEDGKMTVWRVVAEVCIAAGGACSGAPNGGAATWDGNAFVGQLHAHEH